MKQPEYKINKAWFLGRLHDNGQTQADLARFLEVHPAQVSLLLNGKRRIHTKTAERIASFLNSPIEDVLAHVGVAVSAPKHSAGVHLVGIVSAAMKVARVDGQTVAAPPNLPTGAVAVRCQTAGTAADFMDGWLLFYNQAASVDPEAARRLAVAELEDGSLMVGNIRRGYEARKFNLVTCGGLVENLPVRRAWHVLAVIP